MAHGGQALGRHEGRVVFVTGGIAGEEVAVEIVEEKKRYARARLIEVLSPSPHRVEPPCPHFGLCGGCQWQHIAYDAQLGFKRDIVRDQLARLAGLPDVPVHPVAGMADPWRYRNHVQLVPDVEGRLGYRQAETHRVVAIEECRLMHPLVDDLFAALDLDLPQLQRLSLRAGVRTGDQLIIFETRDGQPPQLEIDVPVSCVFLTNDGLPLTLIGYDYIMERVAGREYRISAPSFFQVNTAQAERLVEMVAEDLSPAGDETLLDAYCGVGLFGLSLAGRVRRVIGVEGNPWAVADARFNAQDVANVEVVEGAVEDVVAGLDESVTLAVADPPRQGLAPAVRAALGRLAPRRLAYVSCDPATLARDARALMEAGYRLRHVRPVDMFPQTYHVESVALWEREK